MMMPFEDHISNTATKSIVVVIVCFEANYRSFCVECWYAYSFTFSYMYQLLYSIQYVS